MTVTLELGPEVESLLEKRARAEGCDVKGYVEKLVEKEVNRERTFDEILAPFRDAVERSGISERRTGHSFYRSPARSLNTEPRAVATGS
jgi:hypothetical protein